MSGRRRKKLKLPECDACFGTGRETNDSLEGIWYPPGVGFLVCGGPSLKSLDLAVLRQRGIVSLGVNNSAGFAPCRAWTFSDPQYKFHHGMFVDPAMITFCPTPKLGKHVRVKIGDEFKFTDMPVADCPNTWGYQRRTVFDPETFLTDWFAHWGYGGKQGGERSFTKINTMFCGMRLLHYLGIRTMFLLGVDFQRDGSDHYAWGQEKGAGGGFGKSIELLRRLRPAVESQGLRIFNCNPTSALDVFDYVPFDVAVELARSSVPREPFDLSDWYNKSPVVKDKAAIKAKRYDFYPLSERI